MTADSEDTASTAEAAIIRAPTRMYLRVIDMLSALLDAEYVVSKLSWILCRLVFPWMLDAPKLR